MRQLVVVSMALLCVLSGCAARQWGFDFPENEEAVYDHPLEEVWPSVRGLFQESGFEVREDAANFVLETEWREEFAGSKVAGYWHRYMVLGKKESPSRSRLLVLRSARSANTALRHPGKDIDWRVSRVNRSTGETETPEDLQTALLMPDGDNGVQAETQDGARDLVMEWKLHQRITPTLVAKASGGSPEEVVKRVEQPSGSPVAMVECGMPILGLGKVARRGDVLLLGELHGTREVPHFIAQSACQFSTNGIPVTVGLELPVENQERVQRFMASAGTEEDWAKLMESPFWRSPYPDGRSSEAVAYLIEALRKLRSQGLDVDAFVFDHPQLEGEAREEAMAKTVLTAAERAKQRLVLVVSGNIHPRLVEGLPWKPSYQPMGVRIAERHPSVRSLDMAFNSGTAWICSVNEATKLECGVRPAKGKDNGDRYFVHLFDGLSREGFHGIFYVGPVNASLPAVYNGAEPAGASHAPTVERPAPGR